MKFQIITFEIILTISNKISVNLNIDLFNNGYQFFLKSLKLDGEQSRVCRGCLEVEQDFDLRKEFNDALLSEVKRIVKQLSDLVEIFKELFTDKVSLKKFFFLNCFLYNVLPLLPYPR